MSNIDLHTHSVYSDGTYTPVEIVNYAQEKGLSAVSLTDHDTIDGLDEARMIKDYMAKLKVMRVEHNIAILKALHSIGIDINYGELEKQSPKGTITRLNIAKMLAQKGYTETVKDALHRYLHKEGTAYVEAQNQPFSVVAKKIHDAGGVVSLAHPAEYGLSYTDTERLVKYLVEYGLDAIECIHPTQNTAYSQKMINLSKQYNLSLTGGSDFHGKNEDGIDLGMGGDKMIIPESFLTELHVR